jgi:hypothetical protein
MPLRSGGGLRLDGETRPHLNVLLTQSRYGGYCHINIKMIRGEVVAASRWRRSLPIEGE